MELCDKAFKLLFVLTLVFCAISQKSVIKCDNALSPISSPQDETNNAQNSSSKVGKVKKPPTTYLQENEKKLMQNDTSIKYCTDARNELIALVKGQLNLNTIKTFKSFELLTLIL